MKRRQSSVLDILERVRRFMDDHASQLGDLNTSGSRRALDTLTLALAQHAVDQLAHRNASSAEVVVTRVMQNALMIRHMRPVARIAAFRLRDVPELRALSTPPRNTTPRRLIVAARAMADAAKPYASTFVEAGLPLDFLARMDAAATALDGSIGRKGSADSIRLAATAAMRDDVTRARQIVKILSSLIEPLLDGDDATLAQWRAARRYPRERSAASSNPPSPPRALPLYLPRVAAPTATDDALVAPMG